MSAQGEVQTAELNLSYTTVSAPFTGLSSFAKLQEGTYLSTSNNLLTYVAQIDPIWVNFSISQNEQSRFRDEVERGLLPLPEENRFLVKARLADGSLFPSLGTIGFAEPSFSKETGTYLVRAVFANPRATAPRPVRRRQNSGGVATE